jgi:ADP-ribose pyrophosphatase YjhB (NUDIX family)
MRLYWRLTHPTTEGALVALWNRDEVLLVRNSYVPYYCVPGGYIRRGEAAADAVVRELAEEVGISASVADLQLVLDRTHEWEGKTDHVRIFSLDVATRPEVRVDHREVIEASWWPPEKALALTLFPPLRTVLEAKCAAKR